MKYQTLYKKSTLLSISYFALVYSCLVSAVDFAPPKISIVDKFGVNVATGQISQSLNTVSIGGAMGLSHNISAYTNEFSMTGYRGYQDKFYAITRTRVIGERVSTYGFLDALNVHDFEDSVDFIIKVNGQHVNAGTDATSGYTYEPLGDERHTLTVGIDGYLTWTKPNGTIVRFKRRPGAKAADTAIMETVIYPNNFRINIESPYSVTTNTGFALKYIFVDDHGSSSSSSSSVSPIPSSPVNLQSRLIASCAYNATWDASQSATYYVFRSSNEVNPAVQTTNLSQTVLCTPGDINSNKARWVQACNTYGCSAKSYFPGMEPPIGEGANIPEENPLLWSQRNPKYIQAVNNAIENCTADNVLCSSRWAKATFTWPERMPRRIFVGDSTFKVTDAVGGITEFHFRGYDLAYSEYGTLIPNETPGQRWSPRLVGVKPASSSIESISYTYKNLVTPKGNEESNWVELAQEAGVIVSAKNINASAAYSINLADRGDDTKNTANGLVGGVMSVSKRSQYPGTLNEVLTTKGYSHYEPNTFRNFMDLYSPLGGVSQNYEYTRGNLTKITEGTATSQAEYPASCDSVNYRYCNKPIWVSDFNGNKTYFTYHSLSGEIATITSPPDKNGNSKVVRNYYEQKHANYYKTGVKIQGDDIWLKVAEKSCNNTKTIGDACSGNMSIAADKDEMVTKYEYNNDNLLLSGIVVTAMGSDLNPRSERTCYQYDIYGNRIGETQPNANLSSCNP